MKANCAVQLFCCLLWVTHISATAQTTKTKSAGVVSEQLPKQSWESLHVDMPYSAGKDFLSKKTLKELVAAAENGDADSQEKLGRAYQYGFQEIKRDQVRRWNGGKRQPQVDLLELA